MKKIIILLLVIVTIFLVGCQTENYTSTQDQNEKITVVTTVFPLYEFASKVGGDHVEVTLLLPLGAEPHSYEPKPSDIRTIQNADVFIYIGEGMEPWAHDILEGLDVQDLSIIEASNYVDLLELHHDDHADEAHADEEHADEEHGHDHGDYDSHIWLDFENNVKIVEQIRSVFSQINSSYTNEFEQNAQNYSEQLLQLDSDYSSNLSNCVQNTFLVGGHNFFGYIEQNYNIRGISAIENLEPNTEPTPQRIKQIADTAKQYEINYILTEVLVSTQMSEALASEVGAQVLVFNPASNLAKDDFESGVSFIDIMRGNLNTLHTALECQ